MFTRTLVYVAGGKMSRQREGKMFFRPIHRPLREGDMGELVGDRPRQEIHLYSEEGKCLKLVAKSLGMIGLASLYNCL
jgi:hypothetical protein